MDHKISKDMISSGMIPSGEKSQADLGRTQYGSAPSPSSLMDAYKSIYEHHQKDADGKVIEHGEKEELSERVRGGGVTTSLPKKKEYQKVVDKLTGYQQTQKGVGAASLIPDSAFSNPNPRRTTRNEMVKSPLAPLAAKAASAIGKNLKRRATDNKGLSSLWYKGESPKADTPSEPSPKTLSQDVDLFDIIKGRLLDEGADEEEALKIMANISQEDFDKLKEDITLTKGDYASRNSAGSAYSTAKSKGFKGYKAGGGLGADFLPRV